MKIKYQKPWKIKVIIKNIFSYIFNIEGVNIMKKFLRNINRIKRNKVLATAIILFIGSIVVNSILVYSFVQAISFMY